MPDMWIDVDTAVTVPVNLLPLTDDTDFKTRETGIVYNQAGMDLVWNFVTSDGVMTQTAVTPTTAGVYDWTHVGDGMYKIEIPASGGASINNDTEGYGWFTGICTGVLAWRGPVIGFRAAGLNDLLCDNVYDSAKGLAGTDLDTIQVKADRNADLIESQRGAHTWQGDIWYVDPVNGNDTTGDGSRALPYATVTKAHTSATDNNHDVIFLVAGNSGGVTTLTEQVTLSKNYIFIRGPGRDFLWNYNANGDVITVTGVGVELSGFRVQTHTTGSGDAINISGDFCRAHNIWTEYARQYGIFIDNSSWCHVYNNSIHECGKDAASAGVYVGQSSGTTQHNRIYDNVINDTTGAAIEVKDASEDTIIMNNNLHTSSTYGVLINAGALRTGVYRNRFSNNTLGRISDAGTNTTLANENFTKADELDVNVQSVNDIEIVGNGSTVPFNVP